jgi:hypothetical protein
LLKLNTAKIQLAARAEYYSDEKELLLHQQPQTDLKRMVFRILIIYQLTI